jgi:hypothetical protein
MICDQLKHEALRLMICDQLKHEALRLMIRDQLMAVEPLCCRLKYRLKYSYPQGLVSISVSAVLRLVQCQRLHRPLFVHA